MKLPRNKHDLESIKMRLKVISQIENDNQKISELLELIDELGRDITQLQEMDW